MLDANPLEPADIILTIEAMAVSLYGWVQSLHEKDMFCSDARIIAYTSEGSTKPMKNYAAVSAAKAALESISRSIALEFATQGIRCNCIQAGITDTKSLRMIPNSAEILEYSKQRNPSGRVSTADDIANITYLLCRDEAQWITGTTIIADGGESLR
jgi:enoyl-[acyl-carrier protein] reductase I